MSWLLAQRSQHIHFCSISSATGTVRQGMLKADASALFPLPVPGAQRGVKKAPGGKWRCLE